MIMACSNVVVHGGLKPVMLMVLVQIAYAAMNVLYKLAVNDGMSLWVAIAYRFLFATAFIAPLALVLERKNRPKMTWTVLFQSFLCGLFGGALSQNLYLAALSLTSATFTSAMANLTPAITFLMTLSTGMERLNLGTGGGKGKMIGTLTGIGGAMVMTFVKGVEIQMGSFFHVNLLHNQKNNNNGSNMKPHHHHVASSGGRTILGALCALGCGISYSIWLIIQAKMSKTYRSHYSSTALMSLWGSLISIVFALCIERDWTQWRLGWNIRLLTVAYSGIVVSGVMYAVISWCVRMRGPLFASVFGPLMLVMVAFAGSTMLNENLYIGSIVGAALIVCGLFIYVWGKSKETKKMMNQLVKSSEGALVSNKVVEVIVTSSAVVEDKSKHNNSINIHDNYNNNAANMVIRDNEDLSENRHNEEHGRHDDVHNNNNNKGRREGGGKDEEGTSLNNSHHA